MPRSLATRTFLMSVLLSIVVFLDACTFAIFRREHGSDFFASAWLAFVVLAVFTLIAFAALLEISRDLRLWRQRLSRSEFQAALLRLGKLALLWSSTILVLVLAFHLESLFDFVRFVLPGFFGLPVAWHRFHLGRRADEV